MNKTILAIIAAALLAACVARREPPDARGVAFPVAEDSYRKDGIVVPQETLRLVQPGLDKDQVRQLLVAPHFTEGLFFVHDWNYLLKLSHDGAWLDCQLQVQFDEHGRVRASYWKSEACAAQVPMKDAAASLGGEPAATASAPAQGGVAPAPGAESNTAAATPQTLTDLRFPFGRSDIGALRSADLERLNAFSTQIAAGQEQTGSIRIVGHADRLGSAKRKYRRSLARAETVAQVFVAHGIDPRRIEVIGRSDRDATADCAAVQPRDALHACLAPDRHVGVAVSVAPASGGVAQR